MSNVEVIRGLYEAFSQGDMATVLGGMDPNIEWQRRKAIRISQAVSRGGVLMRS